jgi:1A family penicillin-binding protein
MLLGVLVMGMALYLAIDILPRIPDPRSLTAIRQMPEATVVFDASDQPVFTIFREQRVRVPLDQLPRHFIDAVLAIEDRRFYRHWGVDPRRIAGAAGADLTARRFAQGGSTITQQLARQSLLSTEKTFRRKLVEVFTALRIERTYSKNEILELYLNRIYFGSGYYGAEAAARGYFGDPATGLTLSEAALLAGLIQAPERYSPAASPQQAIARRNVVLDAMLETGAIDERAYEQARNEPLTLKNGLESANGQGSYFKEEIRRKLVDMFGWEAVYEQGLRVYSTIDPAMQRAAQEAVELGAQRIEARPNYRHARRNEVLASAAAAAGSSAAPDYLQGALIAMDPRTGEVRALVGGRDFSASSFNRGTQARRQPGSAFKPIVYAAALDQGLTASAVLDNLDQPYPGAQGAWLPADGHDTATSLTVRAALQMSSNRAAIRVLDSIGIDRTVEYAGRLGLGPQPAVPSLALGSGSVTLQDLTAAYAAFANKGVVPQPTFIRRVTDSAGTVLFETRTPHGQESPPAIKDSTAFIMASLLRGVVDSGTGAGVRREGFLGLAAGKTGTTNEYKDAWFIGFTPDLIAGVWLGFDDPQTIISGGYASDVAVPVWARFMTSVFGSRPPVSWLRQPPDVVSVEICALTGMVAVERCRQQDPEGPESRRPTYSEYFAVGTEPTELCPLHRNRSPLAFLAAPFRSLRRADPLPQPEPEPVRAAERPLDARQVSVEVVHDHVFGSCAGRLVADSNGLRYVTDHKDTFWIGVRDIADLQVNSASRRLRLATPQGRVYNFTAAPSGLEGLILVKATLRPD